MSTTQSPDAIERDILKTQNTISDTVEELQERFSPRALMDSLIGGEGDGSDKLIDAARTNPLALGLIGVGALMLASGKSPSLSSLGIGSDQSRIPAEPSDPHHRSYLAHMNAVEHRDGEAADAYRRRRDSARANYFMLEQGQDEDESAFRKRLDEAGETLRQRTSAFGDALSEQAHRLSDGASSAADTARDAGRRASAGAQRAYERNPMVGGLIAAAVGAILGAVIPDTRYEDETLGALGEEARSKAAGLVEQGKEKAADLAEQGKRKAAEGAHKALDQADATLDRATDSGDGSASTGGGSVGGTTGTR